VSVKKAELITWIATLPDDCPTLAPLDAIRQGRNYAESGETLRTLKEISVLTRKHATWLWRLRVPELCGEYFGGRKTYKLSRVLEYLKSEGCRERIVELGVQRKRREAIASAVMG
jgi:hypothetical protein